MSKDLNGEQLADYAVCPEAWRLKYVVGNEHSRSSNLESNSIKREWTAGAELRQELRKYAKIIFALLATITGGILLLDSFGFTPRITKHIKGSGISSSTVPTEIALLLLVVGLLIFVWDLFDRRATRIQETSGMSKNSELLSAKGSSILPAKALRSRKQQLYSKPFALVKEDKHVIPVDVYPTSNKVQDRHVLPLLLHLFILEEDKKVRPPYGILLMGKKRRRVQIANSDEKQRWLRSIVDEMRSIQDGVPAIASPSPRKCQNCDVEKFCEHSRAKQ